MNDLCSPDKIRLQAYLAHCGVASRRSCEELIVAGRVSVNGEVCNVLGTKVSPGDEVRLDGKIVRPEKRKIYVALNKPKGYVCTLSDEMGRPCAADILKTRYRERLYNVGRLDMYSEGLILFTNDGDFAAKVSHPSSQIEKEYLIETVFSVPRALCEKFCAGVRIDGVFYRCAKAEIVGKNRVKIALVEGKNREIRTVFNYFGAKIRRLLRFRIGGLTLDGLDLYSGDFCELEEAEIRELAGK